MKLLKIMSVIVSILSMMLVLSSICGVFIGIDSSIWTSIFMVVLFFGTMNFIVSILDAIGIIKSSQ